VKRLIIICAGEYGREVLNIALKLPERGRRWKIAGFLDNRADILKGYSYRVPLLSSVEEYVPKKNDLFVCAIGDPQAKRKYCSLVLSKGGQFTNLIHPTCLLGSNVVLGKGVILGPYSWLNCDVKLGDFVTITGFGGCAHDCQVGDWSQISGHCGINGNAVLEEGVFLGSHVCVLPRARVGAWSYVGAGSVVLRRVAPGAKVFGNPAVEIGQ
jgi:sugar O-acyltransferase (sialic acid O-acetyltransferase NeuD family)